MSIKLYMQRLASDIIYDRSIEHPGTQFGYNKNLFFSIRRPFGRLTEI